MQNVKDRRYYIDNIRACCVFSLFIWHTCEVFHCKEGFYVEGEDTLFFTIIYCFASPWVMAVLFFIAGIAAKLSLEKRDIKLFYKNRFETILRPIVFGVLLWIPWGAVFTLKYNIDYKDGVLKSWLFFFTNVHPDMYGYDGSFTPNQLWFMCFLFAYVCLLYPLLRNIRDIGSRLASKIKVSPFSIILVILTNFILCYGGTEETFIAFGMFFVLGLLLSDNKTFYTYTKEKWKHFLILALIANISASFALIHIRDIVNIWSWEYATCRLIWSVGRVMGVLAMMGIGQSCLNRSTKIWNYLARNSYNYYFLHMQILIAVAYFVIKNSNVYVGIQWLMIFVFSIIGTIIAVEVLKRIVIFRWMFGLK